MPKQPDTAKATKKKRVPPPPKPRQKIREAGPDGMKDPPEEWDEVDESSDESFPASDAPAKY